MYTRYTYTRPHCTQPRNSTSHQYSARFWLVHTIIMYCISQIWSTGFPKACDSISYHVTESKMGFENAGASHSAVQYAVQFSEQDS